MTVLTVSCYYIFARMVRLIAICTDKSNNTYPELFNMQIVLFWYVPDVYQMFVYDKQCGYCLGKCLNVL